MNEQTERINGWAAMLGIVAAMGAYATTGQVIPGIWWWDSNRSSNNDGCLRCRSIDDSSGEESWIGNPSGLLVGFIIVYLMTEPEDHDGDGPDKGIMSPVYEGT